MRRYVPELEQYGDKYIYEPWKTPLADQKQWGCLIKGDGDGKMEGGEDRYNLYPKPMFDFDERRRICIEGVKGAYKFGLYGADERIQDGSWSELFPSGAEGVDEESIDRMIEGSTEQLHEGRTHERPIGHAENESIGKGMSSNAKDDGSNVAAGGDESSDGYAQDGKESGGEKEVGDHASAGGKIGGGVKGRKASDKSTAKRKRQGTLDGVLVQKRGKKQLQ